MRISAFVVILMLGLGRAPAAELAIGVLLPSEKTEAKSLRRGVELALAHANQSDVPKVGLRVGGVVGQWGTAGEVVGEMVLDDGVAGLIAPDAGAASHLALQVAGRTETPVISLCPDSSVVGAGIPWMVQIAPGTYEEARLIFSSANSGRDGGAFRWNVLIPKGRVGREVARDLGRAAEAAGCPLGDLVEAGTAGEDSTTSLKQILTEGADGVLLWLDAAAAGGWARALRAEGFEGRLAGPSHLQSAQFFAKAGDAAEDVAMPRPALDEASRSVATRFAADYQRRYGIKPDITACLAYDAGMLLTDLVRRAGESPVRQLFPIRGDRPGASGRLKFDRDGRRLVPLELVRIRDGKSTVLLGAARAQPGDRIVPFIGLGLGTSHCRAERCAARPCFRLEKLLASREEPEIRVSLLSP